jgi:hypothetical protein
MKKLIICGAVLGAVAACGHGSDKGASSAELTGLDIVNNDNAVIRISNARCDREYNCNNVGAGQKYQDQNACLREIHQNVQGSLRVDQCPGVDQSKLARCLADVQNERCGNPLDSIERISSCRRSELCVGGK